MVDNALMTVVDFLARCSKAETEIDVFPAIDKGGVEPTHLVPGLSSDQTTGCRYHLESTRDIDRRVVFRKASIDVVGEAAGSKSDPGMLDGVIGEEEFRTDNPCRGVRVGIVNKRRQPTWGRHRVVV